MMILNSSRITSALVLLLFQFSRSDAFSVSKSMPFPAKSLLNKNNNLQSPRTRFSGAPAAKVSPEPAAVSVRSYEHDGFTLKYRYLPPSSAAAKEKTPLLLIHPVGIGMSSWFWDQIMAAWQEKGDNPAIYAVNLMGCGVGSDGADAWEPDEQGMTIPLGWVKGCEALMEQVIFPEHGRKRMFGIKSAFGGEPHKCNVIVQGGLAPVGVQLASRNPSTVQNLVLTSPPVWDEMVTAVPEQELDRNYNFLRSPFWGNLAFGFLETRQAVEFFSNAFLFEKTCDPLWLDACDVEMGVAVRPPVQVFNAGFCQYRSWRPELESLPQPLLILQGRNDQQRLAARGPYETSVPNCRIETIAGKNVLPWEAPEELIRAVQDFV